MIKVLALLTLLTVNAGGWAVITVEDLPDQVVVGQSDTLTFTVRQHGRAPLGGLKPTVEAEASGRTVRVAATPGSEPGRYIASLTLPNAGPWTLTIHSGFGNSRVKLMPLPAVNPGRSAPPLADTDRGRRLFVAKGCLTCHLHAEVPASGAVAAGPELTGRRYPVDYMQRFLADPAGVAQRTIEMPNLNLKQQEIAALVAFMNAERQALRSGS